MHLEKLLGECADSLDRWSYGAFLFGVLGAAVSLPLGRAGLALTLVLVGVALCRQRVALRASAALWWALAFILVTVVVTFNGIDPARGVRKLDKLLWFAGIFIAPMVLTTRLRLLRVLEAYVAGNVITAVKTLVERPIAAHQNLANGAKDVMFAWADGASMTDAQRLMLGLLAAIGLVFLARRLRGSWKTWWWLALVLEAAALLMTFKRGSWICAALASSLLFGALTRWRYIVLPLVLLGGLLLLPPVTSRLRDLGKEFNVDGGGRLTMWCKIAPALIKDHPWGIGERALTNDLMRHYAPEVEPDRDHLHSNIAQVLVSAGWLGFGLYTLWMLAALRDGWRYMRCAKQVNDPTDVIVATTLLCMLVALLCNGSVEYNIGDGEIVLAYGFIIGACTSGRIRMEQAR